VKIQPQWVVTPGKQTNNKYYGNIHKYLKIKQIMKLWLAHSKGPE
jgi:hypothetical protein